MADILLYGSKALRIKATPVKVFDASLAALLDEMRAAMERANGIGLSANQIGSPLAVCVLAVDGNYYEMINPEIRDGESPKLMPEACLSIPNYAEKVVRWQYINAKAYDRYGNAFKVNCDGVYSHVLQHEVDHLNGMMFVDRLDPKKQRKFQSAWWGDE